VRENKKTLSYYGRPLFLLLSIGAPMAEMLRSRINILLRLYFSQEDVVVITQL
jgi:hypothetical protein